jgi:hypothetical protein
MVQNMEGHSENCNVHRLHAGDGDGCNCPYRLRWRQGGRVNVNVYVGDTPVCQCQTPEYAQLIVEAVNTLLEGRK